MDQVGCQIGIVASSLVVVPTNYDTVYIDDPTNKELVTITECISVGGYYVPAIITFKGAYHLRKYFKNNTDRDILQSRLELGFTNNRLCLAQLEHFKKFIVSRTKGRYCMLIFNRYRLYLT